MQPNMQLVFLAAKVLVRVQLGVLQVLLANCFPVRARPVLCMGLFHTGQGLVLALIVLHDIHHGPFLQHIDCSPVLTLSENLQGEYSFPLSSSLYRHFTILVLRGTSEVLFKEVAAICTSDP